MASELDNEWTPIAEHMWQIYTQLLRAGFERLDALHLVGQMLREMIGAKRHAP